MPRTIETQSERNDREDERLARMAATLLTAYTAQGIQKSRDDLFEEAHSLLLDAARWNDREYEKSTGRVQRPSED